MNELQVMLSSIFAFIGAFTLFISTLICGHNIFKDLPFRISATVSGFIGFWLFVFSPISFIIIFPQLFVSPAELAVLTTKGMIIRIHLLIKESILSFLLSAIGLGAVIGALSEIKPRKSFLVSLNRKFGLHLREFTYDFAWDLFLRGIKKMGVVTLVLKDKQVTGHLQNYSVTSEPKQIILKRCTVAESDGSADQLIRPVENILITEVSEIKEIIAGDSAFKKHYHELNHCSQTTYLLIAALGCTLLAASGKLTIHFLDRHQVSEVAYMYAGASFFFSCAALVLMLLAARTLKHDFKTFTATAAFYPPLTTTLAVLAPISYYLGIHALWIYAGKRFDLDLPMLGVVFIATLSFVLMVLSHIKYRVVTEGLRQLINRNTDDYSMIKEIIAQLYILCDFNSDNRVCSREIASAVIEDLSHWTDTPPVKIKDLISMIYTEIDKLVQRHPFLEKEEPNIVIQWHELLKNDLLIQKNWYLSHAVSLPRA